MNVKVPNVFSEVSKGTIENMMKKMGHKDKISSQLDFFESRSCLYKLVGQNSYNFQPEGEIVTYVCKVSPN